MSRLSDDIERLCQAHRRGSDLVLLFDYDGTLAPFADHPSQATLPVQTRALLTYFVTVPRVIPGIISGRKLEDLMNVVRIPGLFYAGTSGLELDLRGQRVVQQLPEEDRQTISDAAEGLNEIIKDHPGAWVENKGFGLTLHYRAVPPDRVEMLREQAFAFLARRPQLKVLEGPCALEVTLRHGWNKGSAVSTIVQHIGNKPALLYAGDEANDEDAFATVNELGGVSIGVGDRAPSNATHRLPDPEALVEVLQQLKATCTIATCQ
ncbi:MAG: trehalose 6-phosphate phosphatase [Gemmatales bacterium]|nr:MAG: trehalose 6-phosphate phosphatase [Gemmatales bacterium]